MIMRCVCNNIVVIYLSVRTRLQAVSYSRNPYNAKIVCINHGHQRVFQI